MFDLILFAELFQMGKLEILHNLRIFDLKNPIMGLLILLVKLVKMKLSDTSNESLIHTGCGQQKSFLSKMRRLRTTLPTQNIAQLKQLVKLSRLAYRFPLRQIGAFRP